MIHWVLVRQEPASTAAHVQAQNFTRFTFRKDFKGPAANFAVGRELLGAGGSIHDQFKGRAAKRAHDRLGNFHKQTLPPSAHPAKRVLVASVGSWQGCPVDRRQ